MRRFGNSRLGDNPSVYMKRLSGNECGISGSEIHICGGQLKRLSRGMR